MIDYQLSTFFNNISTALPPPVPPSTFMASRIFNMYLLSLIYDESCCNLPYESNFQASNLLAAKYFYLHVKTKLLCLL